MHSFANMSPPMNRNCQKGQPQCAEGSDDSSDCSFQAVDSNGEKRKSKSKNSEDYKKRRERNNIAVKKSRSKSKMKTMQTLERVNQLKAENEMLEQKVKTLTKELSFLKDLFLAHAGNAHGQNLSSNELNTLLSEDTTPGSWIEATDIKKQNVVKDHKYYSSIKSEV